MYSPAQGSDGLVHISNEQKFYQTVGTVTPLFRMHWDAMCQRMMHAESPGHPGRQPEDAPEDVFGLQYNEDSLAADHQSQTMSC